MAADYAATALYGGVPIESTIGKAYEHKHALEKITGLNPGIENNAAGGICALKYLDQVVGKHSSYRHDGTQSMHLAMKRDFRENLAPGPGAVVSTFIEHLPWLELAQQFLQACGPCDIKVGVQSMTNDVMTAPPTSTLQARAQTIVHAWRQAQFTYYSVFAGLDGRGFPKPPKHCTPFVPPHEELAILKSPLELAGPALSFNFFSNAE